MNDREIIEKLEAQLKSEVAVHDNLIRKVNLMGKSYISIESTLTKLASDIVLRIGDIINVLEVLKENLNSSFEETDSEQTRS